MNELSNIRFTNCTLDYPLISGGSINAIDNFSTSSYATFRLDDTSVVFIGDYTISGATLRKKLELLDRLIEQYLPEELI